jgi:hypothetical protein
VKQSDERQKCPTLIWNHRIHALKVPSFFPLWNISCYVEFQFVQASIYRHFLPVTDNCQKKNCENLTKFCFYEYVNNSRMGTAIGRKSRRTFIPLVIPLFSVLCGNAKPLFFYVPVMWLSSILGSLIWSASASHSSCQIDFIKCRGRIKLLAFEYKPNKSHACKKGKAGNKSRNTSACLWFRNYLAFLRPDDNRTVSVLLRWVVSRDRSYEFLWADFF